MPTLLTEDSKWLVLALLGLQLPLYLFVHRTLLEKTFDVEEFLEGSKVAYSVGECRPYSKDPTTRSS